MCDRVARYVALCLLVLLGGCEFVLPSTVSATAEVSASGSPMRQVELTPAQLQGLVAWFSQHKSGWSSSRASYVPVALVRVKHSNGDVSVVNISPTMVVVYNREGQYVQRFPERETDALRRIVGLSNG